MATVSTALRMAGQCSSNMPLLAIAYLAFSWLSSATYQFHRLIKIIFTMTWVYYATPELEALSKWPRIMAVCISLTSLMTATVLTRLWARTCMVKSIGIDDYIMAVSMVGADVLRWEVELTSSRYAP